MTQVQIWEIPILGKLHIFWKQRQFALGSIPFSEWNDGNYIPNDMNQLFSQSFYCRLSNLKPE